MGEPTLADVISELPDWVCWRGLSGMYYACHESTSEDRDTTLTYDAKGEDPIVSDTGKATPHVQRLRFSIRRRDVLVTSARASRWPVPHTVNAHDAGCT
jgi:hypothetical protein